jgi:hypothetical protein
VLTAYITADQLIKVIIKKKHSLTAHLFKADYFPNYFRRHNNKPGLCYKRNLKQAFKIQNRLKAKL